MPEPVYLGFDFGFKRIGVAVGQALTKRATPLITVSAVEGEPSWPMLHRLMKEWKPAACIVGLPTTIQGEALYTTKAAKRFALKLEQTFSCPVYLEDERLSTVEARSQLFEEGGYRQLRRADIDSVAACIILEQWLLENV